MSKERLNGLLNQCLLAHDAGLTPDECLSAWPEHRAQLEPLLRQALRLRMAFTASPREDFRAALHEKVMFAAGREVRQALVVNPDSAFLVRTRNRLRYAAGASAQEALRSVPPPKLAFWTNARRRLLEAASSQTRRPAGRPMAMAMRSGLSAAVVVLALVVVGLAYATSQSRAPSAKAELASIEQQVQRVEQQVAAGAPAPAETVLDLSRRSASLADKQPTGPVAEKLTSVIDRQQAIVSQASAASASPPPALQEAQQHLQQAEGRLAAARAPDSSPPLSTQPTVAPATGSQPLATAASGSASSPAPAATAVPLAPGQVRFSPLPNDTTFGVSWIELTAASFHVAIPAGWTPVGLTPNAQGVVTPESSLVRIDNLPAVILFLNITNGEINALADGQNLNLRERGATGRSISVAELVAKASPVASELSHVLESFVWTLPVPTPTTPATPATTATPPPSPTP